MSDPLADVVKLLRPRAVYSKVISGAGSWAVRYSAFGEPSFCTMLVTDACFTCKDDAISTTRAYPFSWINSWIRSR